MIFDNSDRSRRKQERDIVIPKVADPARRERCEADIYRWLSTYLPESFEQEFTRNRRLIVEAILEVARGGGDQSIAAPRGEGKTTIAESVTVYAILTGLLKFPLIVASTGPDADRILSNIKYHFETNELLLDDYPEVCVPIRALEGAPQRCNMQTADGQPTRMRWSGNLVIFPTVDQRHKSRACGTILMTRGLDAAIRGIKVGAKRPDFVLIDDPETRESAASETQIERRRKTIEQDIAGTSGGGKKFGRLMLTTLQNRTSLSAEFTDRALKPSWRGIRLKLLEQLPENTELWDEYILRRQTAQQIEDPDKAREALDLVTQFYADNREEMDRGAIVTNPVRYIPGIELSALQACYNVIADRGWEAFATEYQNDPPEEEGPEESGITAALVQQRLNEIPRGVVPSGTQCLTAAIDVGKYLLHWVVVAWKANATGFVVDYGRHETAANREDSDQAVEAAIHRALHEWREVTVSTPYPDDAGNTHPIKLTLVDAGYMTTAVYRFCMDVGAKGFHPSHGVGDAADKQRSFAMKGAGKRPGDFCCYYKQPNGLWLLEMDSDHWKRYCHERFLTPPDRPGSLTLFGDVPRDHLSYANHIASEVEEEEFVRGKGLRRRWNKKARNNHWFDATYMACVASSICGVRLLSPSKPGGERTRKPASRRTPGRLLDRPGGWVRGME